MKRKQTVKIISLEATKDRVYTWVECEKQYVLYIIFPNRLTVEERHPKDEFEDYEHFVGVMGKFNPETAFFAEPIDLPLEYDDLLAEADRRNPPL